MRPANSNTAANPAFLDDPTIHRAAMGQPRQLAALALGLAHSGLAPEHAIAELASSASREILIQARSRLADPGHTPPAVADLARSLIDQALSVQPR